MEQKQLEEALKVKISSLDTLSGGSGDKIYLLHASSGSRFIHKTGTVGSISAQIDYYRRYQESPLLPRLLFAAPDSSELVISYIEPIRSNPYNKKAILKQLVAEHISKYTQIETGNYGFVSNLTHETFADFLAWQAKEAYTHISQILPERDLDYVLALIADNYHAGTFSTRYYLHGDLGFHNFFYSADQLLGVIDPDPVIGHPIYDLLYAFCSTPLQINLAELHELANELNKYFQLDLNAVNKYFKVALFKRISSCKKHHPFELDNYLELWRELAKV